MSSLPTQRVLGYPQSIPPSPYRPKDTRTALADNRHPAMGVEEAAATTI